jgi:hypothetical protein
MSISTFWATQLQRDGGSLAHSLGVVVIRANHYWADAIVAAAIVAAAWNLTAGHWFERGRSLLGPTAGSRSY